jgi:hypothetical protein
MWLPLQERGRKFIQVVSKLYCTKYCSVVVKTELRSHEVPGSKFVPETYYNPASYLPTIYLTILKVAQIMQSRMIV